MPRNQQQLSQSSNSNSKWRQRPRPVASPHLRGAASNSPIPLQGVVLNDDVNTFQHVVECLVKNPSRNGFDRAWELAHQIVNQARRWSGVVSRTGRALHQQLGGEGLTMVHWKPAEASQLALDFVGQREWAGWVDHATALP